jgi:alpha-maltose-1-phosphate synthase
MEKLIGVIGSGIIGRDPWDEKSWSGSAKPFFTECKKAGLLHSAIGIEVPELVRLSLMAKNFSPDRSTWRFKFYSDPAYYRALTKAAERKLLNDIDNFDILQLGSIYEIQKITKNKCYSYNDGNIICKMRSPYFDKRYTKFALKALEWEKRINKNLTKIFTMSEYLRQSFINDYEISSERVFNIGAGMNFYIPEEMPKKHDHKNINIIFIGIDFERKGGYILLDAFQKITQKYKSVVLHIIGPKNIGILSNSNVIFHGFFDKNDPNFKEILRQGDIGILPSLYEPFGISMLETMAYGMPGIAPNEYAFPDMIVHNKTGLLIDYVSSENIYNAIEYYLSNQDKMRQHGIDARKYVLDNYGWNRVVEKLSIEI